MGVGICYKQRFMSYCPAGPRLSSTNDSFHGPRILSTRRPLWIQYCDDDGRAYYISVDDGRRCWNAPQNAIVVVGTHTRTSRNSYASASNQSTPRYSLDGYANRPELMPALKLPKISSNIQTPDSRRNSYRGVARRPGIEVNLNLNLGSTPNISTTDPAVTSVTTRRVTEQRVTELPAGEQEALEKRAGSIRWVKHIDPAGVAYYQNIKTGQVTWDEPLESEVGINAQDVCDFSRTTLPRLSVEESAIRNIARG
ncbi:hypothetical protein AAMO2058_000929800 [Amorphochlora amoebiformis]